MDYSQTPPLKTRIKEWLSRKFANKEEGINAITENQTQMMKKTMEPKFYHHKKMSRIKKYNHSTTRLRSKLMQYGLIFLLAITLMSEVGGTDAIVNVEQNLIQMINSRIHCLEDALFNEDVSTLNAIKKLFNSAGHMEPGRSCIGLEQHIWDLLKPIVEIFDSQNDDERRDQVINESLINHLEVLRQSLGYLNNEDVLSKIKEKFRKKQKTITKRFVLDVSIILFQIYMLCIYDGSIRTFDHFIKNQYYGENMKLYFTQNLWDIIENIGSNPIWLVLPYVRLMGYFYAFFCTLIYQAGRTEQIISYRIASIAGLITCFSIGWPYETLKQMTIQVIVDLLIFIVYFVAFLKGVITSGR